VEWDVARSGNRSAGRLMSELRKNGQDLQARQQEIEWPELQWAAMVWSGRVLRHDAADGLRAEECRLSVFHLFQWIAALETWVAFGNVLRTSTSQFQSVQRAFIERKGQWIINKTFTRDGSPQFSEWVESRPAFTVGLCLSAPALRPPKTYPRRNEICSSCP
jgi:hypothetical protein